jgi:type II secretory pathway pseudopilin PulG
MRIVLVLVVIVAAFLVWRAFVFDRRHRGRLRNATDIAGDAKRNRDQYVKGNDAGPPGM